MLLCCSIKLDEKVDFLSKIFFFIWNILIYVRELIQTIKADLFEEGTEKKEQSRKLTPTVRTYSFWLRLHFVS